MGTDGIEPGTERYSLFALVPVAIAIALLLNAISERLEWRMAGVWIAVLLSWGMLVGFDRGVFVAISRTGGNAHITYRSASIEPKLAAFRWIEEDFRAAKMTRRASTMPPLTIISDNWFLYFPLRYLAGNYPDAELDYVQDTYTERRFAHWAKLFGSKIREKLDSGAYFAFFAEPDRERWFKKYFPDLALQRVTIPDSAGRPVVHVWREARRGS
jgi:hypothetical protein